MSWSLKGTYFESCNCDVACPCVFLSPPKGDDCTVLVGWHVDEGNDDGTSLSGLNVALAVHSPGHMAETPWKAALYVDESADEGQREAILKIFGGKGGGHLERLASHIGEIVGVTFTPIEFTVSDGTHALKIPKIADMEVVPMPGQGGGPITITGHPLCIAPGFPATVGKSTKLNYTDHGMAWDLSDRTGFFSPFAYQS